MGALPAGVSSHCLPRLWAVAFGRASSSALSLQGTVAFAPALGESVGLPSCKLRLRGIPLLRAPIPRLDPLVLPRSLARHLLQMVGDCGQPDLVAVLGYRMPALRVTSWSACSLLGGWAYGIGRRHQQSATSKLCVCVCVCRRVGSDGFSACIARLSFTIRPWKPNAAQLWVASIALRSRGRCGTQVQREGVRVASLTKRRRMPAFIRILAFTADFGGPSCGLRAALRSI